MSKYQEALDELCKYCIFNRKCKVFKSPNCEDYEVLKELVDKATPKKPIGKCEGWIYEYKCPICKNILRVGHSCSNNDCRQVIDWSKRQ